MFNMSVVSESFPLARGFTISRGTKTGADVVTVTLKSKNAVGRGECVPYARYGENTATVIAQIESLPADFGQEELQQLLPAGAARNAVDCALWDLRAKISGRRVWQLAGLDKPKAVVTAFTLSLDSAENMGFQAKQNSYRPLLKIKLGSENDIARLETVRLAAPNSRLIVDANEGWSVDFYREIAPQLLRLGVALVEQPLPAGNDGALAEIKRVLPVCADESCHDRSSLEHLTGKYDLVNIKLDKSGGLTEALALRQAAQVQGFGIMVGCMVGTSLGMAPAVLLAQGAALADLDGPLLLAGDRANPLHYDSAGVHPPEPELWG